MLVSSRLVPVVTGWSFFDGVLHMYNLHWLAFSWLVFLRLVLARLVSSDNWSRVFFGESFLVWPSDGWYSQSPPNIL